MLATRIIPVVLMRGGQAVKGQGFASWRNVGQVAMTVRVHDMRGVDELVLLEIGGGLADLGLLRRLAGHCFFPLAVGGGVANNRDARVLLENGADKIVINSHAARRPAVIGEIAAAIGSQSVCVSIDVRDWQVWIDRGSTPTGLKPAQWARMAQEEGAGEILVNDIDLDGTLTGYNLELIAEVSAAVSIPVIACGGAGSYDDFDQALRRGAHAVAAGALWQFTDATPPAAAEHLRDCGWPTRIDAKKMAHLSVGQGEVGSVRASA